MASIHFKTDDSAPCITLFNTYERVVINHCQICSNFRHLILHSPRRAYIKHAPSSAELDLAISTTARHLPHSALEFHCTSVPQLGAHLQVAPLQQFLKRLCYHWAVTMSSSKNCPTTMSPLISDKMLSLRQTSYQSSQIAWEWSQAEKWLLWMLNTLHCSPQNIMQQRAHLNLAMYTKFHLYWTLSIRRSVLHKFWYWWNWWNYCWPLFLQLQMGQVV